MVTGLGAVTPLANGMQASWERLLVGKCGIKRMRPSSSEDPAAHKVRGDDTSTILFILTGLCMTLRI